jgi:hypothetical protein
LRDIGGFGGGFHEIILFYERSVIVIIIINNDNRKLNDKIDHGYCFFSSNGIIELDSEEVFDYDLADIIDDEFIVLKGTAKDVGLMSRAHRNNHAIKGLEVLFFRSGTTYTFC